MNSKVVKFVAGGGKTTFSETMLSNKRNGLYLAFTNSVVRTMGNRGYLSRTIDSLFTRFILPKFTSVIPIIGSGSKLTFIDDPSIPNYLKGVKNINVGSRGVIYNKKKATNFTMEIKNEELHLMDEQTNLQFLKYIFDRNELRLTHKLRDNICSYLISNYKKEIIKFLYQRFSYIIIDEAQDLNDYREEFAKILFESPIPLTILGDENQNIVKGGKWFEKLSATDVKTESFRCPDDNCKWIRENLNIEIYGNNDKSSFLIIKFEDALNYDDGIRTLLYNSQAGKNGRVVSAWRGPKETIKSAKGGTIPTDIVIIGNDLNIKNYYTAITRTKANVYSTISKISR